VGFEVKIGCVLAAVIIVWDVRRRDRRRLRG